MTSFIIKMQILLVSILDILSVSGWVCRLIKVKKVTQATPLTTFRDLTDLWLKNLV